MYLINLIMWVIIKSTTYKQQMRDQWDCSDANPLVATYISFVVRVCIAGQVSGMNIQLIGDAIACSSICSPILHYKLYTFYNACKYYGLSRYIARVIFKSLEIQTVYSFLWPETVGCGAVVCCCLWSYCPSGSVWFIMMVSIVLCWISIVL